MIGHGVPGLSIRQDYDFSATAQAVFGALTEGLDAWWPVAARLTGPRGRLDLMPELGAYWLERGPAGAGVIWGQIDAITAPTRLYLNGWFGVRGVVMGRVHFDIEQTPGGCRLTLLHQAIGPVPEDEGTRHRAAWRDTLDRALRGYLNGVVV